jgi:hypothetical protein
VTSFHIIPEKKTSLESSHGASKGLMDLVRSQGCTLGARGCYADIIPTYFLRLFDFMYVHVYIMH